MNDTQPTDGKAPTVWAYLDYRKYLADTYRHRKSRNAAYSYRRMARMLGIKTPSFLSMVVSEQRHLSAASATKVAEGCQLTDKEESYFLALVEWNQAKGMATKQRCWEEVLRLRQNEASVELKGAQGELLTDWRAVVILEMVRLPDFQPDGQWIASRMRERIEPALAESLLRRLLALGLVVEKNGALSVAAATLLSGAEVPAGVIPLYHHRVGTAGAEAAELPPDQREFAAATITVGEAELAQIKNEIRRFQQRVLAIAEKTQAGEAVCQLNVQFFPLTTPKKDVSS